jgi:SAM-dependent methyltransferase
MDPITDALHTHYEKTFAIHGETPAGVDWGRPEDVALRYAKMLAVLEPPDGAQATPVSLLDVGCGYGGLLEYARHQGIVLVYSGIDVCQNMVAAAARHYPDAEFCCHDIFKMTVNRQFDYVVCNGVLTQKLSAGIREMDAFSQRLIRQMFDLCRRGIAFNVMTTKVNFMVDNLYYRNPVELFAHCLTSISSKVRIDHAYPLYEYTVYLYR